MTLTTTETILEELTTTGVLRLSCSNDGTTWIGRWVPYSSTSERVVTMRHPDSMRELLVALSEGSTV